MSNVIELIKSQIKYYHKCVGTKNDSGERVGNLFKDPGNIAMAEKILHIYERELKKRED